MRIEVIVAIESDWADAHAKDRVKPLTALMHYLRRLSSVEVTPGGIYQFTVSFDPEMVSEETLLSKIKNHMSMRYPEDDIEQILRVELKSPTPEEDDIPILSEFWADDEDGEAAMPRQKEPVLPDPMEKIRALVGAEEFKALAEECVRVAPGLIKHNALDTFVRQCYLFAINDGEGLSTYLDLFGELLTYNKLITVAGDRRIVEIAVSSKENGISEACSAVRRAKTGGKILCIDISECMTALHEPRFRTLLECVNEDAAKNIVVFRVPFVEHNVLAGIKKSLADILSIREVSMVPLDTAELLQCAGDELQRRGFQMGEDAWDILRARIVEEKSDGRFYGINTINKVVREMIYMKQLNNAQNGVDDMLIKKDEILELSDSYQREEKSGMELLDEFIGMDKIKTRVEEIVFQIEMALKEPKLGSPCIHMRFVGNPGTGKTTVARVLGKILKERGILRKGNFFEHSGRDFCGSYIGHTAPKTAAMCRDAYGSVLFIDEAYSLYRSGASSNDFGREAIDTLIAEMENHRSDLVVIMAGYTDEMETLMRSNPGLESRMPYVIEFPNYTRTELRDIFMSMVQKSFEIPEGLREAVEEYFSNLPEEMLTSKEFSNARFVRNLYERTWGKAGVRCRLNREEGIVIRVEDFLAASSEKEFNKLMTKKTRTLGFV